VHVGFVVGCVVGDVVDGLVGFCEVVLGYCGEELLCLGEGGVHVVAGSGGGVVVAESYFVCGGVDALL
jgi:hypothetical protein